MLRTALLALAVVAGLGGCRADEPAVVPGVPGPEQAPPERAPDVAWRAGGATTTLASLRGRTVVFHFADAASPSWAALGEAYPDLDAEGAEVVGVVTDHGVVPGAPYVTTASDLADAFHVGHGPTAVVVDAEGWIRGRSDALDADAFFALAAPVLLDGPLAEPVSVPDADDPRLDAEGLGRLARAGAALVDVRSDAEREADGAVPLALPCPLGTLSAADLPADLAATVVFVGPEAGLAADLAVGWGYSSLVVLTDAAPFVEGPPPTAQPAAPEPEPLSKPRTVRG